MRYFFAGFIGICISLSALLYKKVNVDTEDLSIAFLDLITDRSAKNIFLLLFGGSFSVLGIWYYELSVQWVFFLVLYTILLMISIIDYQTMTIPQELNFSLFLLGLISLCFISESSILSRIGGMACITVPMFLIWYFTGGFGLGDVKLMLGAGLLLGMERVFTAFCIGIVLAGIYVAIGLLKGELAGKSQFPCGPFLCFGILLSSCTDVGEYILGMHF